MIIIYIHMLAHTHTKVLCSILLMLQCMLYDISVIFLLNQNDFTLILGV